MEHFDPCFHRIADPLADPLLRNTNLGPCGSGQPPLAGEFPKCVLEPLTPEPPPQGGGAGQGPGPRVAVPKPPMTLAWDLSQITLRGATQERVGRPIESWGALFHVGAKRPDELASAL
jgi:hypothetical protein